jgi:hypothetical protein
MTEDLVKRLSGIADVLTDLFPEFSKDINSAADRIEKLRAALRKLDDMIYELDAGDLDLYEVGDFIDAALGEKKDD